MAEYPDTRDSLVQGRRRRQVASPIALVPRVALISFPVSAMMTWIVEPQLARLLESWLYAPRRSK